MKIQIVNIEASRCFFMNYLKGKTMLKKNIKEPELFDYSKEQQKVKKAIVKRDEEIIKEIKEISENYNVDEEEAVIGYYFVKHIKLGYSLKESMLKAGETGNLNLKSKEYWNKGWIKQLYLEDYNPDENMEFERERREVISFLMSVVEDESEETKIRIDAAAKLEKYIARKVTVESTKEDSKMNKLLEGIENLIGRDKMIGYGGEVVDVGILS